MTIGDIDLLGDLDHQLWSPKRSISPIVIFDLDQTFHDLDLNLLYKKIKINAVILMFDLNFARSSDHWHGSWSWEWSRSQVVIFPSSESWKSQSSSPWAKQRRDEPVPSWRNHIQSWTNVWECYCRALEKGCLLKVHGDLRVRQVRLHDSLPQELREAPEQGRIV